MRQCAGAPACYKNYSSVASQKCIDKETPLLFPNQCLLTAFRKTWLIYDLAHFFMKFFKPPPSNPFCNFCSRRHCGGRPEPPKADPPSAEPPWRPPQQRRPRKLLKTNEKEICGSYERFQTKRRRKRPKFFKPPPSNPEANDGRPSQEKISRNKFSGRSPRIFFQVHRFV